LFSSASDSRWDGQTALWFFGFNVTAAFFMGINLNWIVRWHRSPLRCWLFVTPLYIIKTHLDRVWFWPIREVSNLRVTHNYRNGVYQNTSLAMAVGSDREKFTLNSRSAYKSLAIAFKTFKNKIRSAKSQQDWSYFFEQDDFREFVPANASQPPRLIPKRTIAIWVLTFVSYGIAFHIAAAVNSDRAPRSNNAYPQPEPHYRPQPTPYYRPHPYPVSLHPAALI
jgi:hypothetical protein